MDCGEARAALHPYVDAEIDPGIHLAIDRHVAECAACARIYGEQQALDAMLKSQTPDFRASPQLRARIEASLSSDNSRTREASLHGSRWWSFAAGICLAVTLTWGWNAHQRAADIQEELMEDAVSVHMRSLMEGHLVDLRSTEPAPLESWFGRHLPYPVRVVDLSAQGYALVGGRLEYLYTQALAAVVYRHGEHLVNVLTWPAGKIDEFPESAMSEGALRVMFFRKGTMNFCVIADLDAAEFRRFARVLMDA